MKVMNAVFIALVSIMLCMVAAPVQAWVLPPAGALVDYSHGADKIFDMIKDCPTEIAVTESLNGMGNPQIFYREKNASPYYCWWETPDLEAYDFQLYHNHPANVGNSMYASQDDLATWHNIWVNAPDHMCDGAYVVDAPGTYQEGSWSRYVFITYYPDANGNFYLAGAGYLSSKTYTSWYNYP